jgi:hypothetical protein
MDYLAPADRAAYEAEQLRKSTKWGYCKTAFADVRRYLDLIAHDRAERQDFSRLGPIVCLGVRNGREVDLFRIARRGSMAHRWLVQGTERRRNGFTPTFPVLEQFGRDRVQQIHDEACIGVELSSRGQRPDVWVGSFDALPDQWTGRFGVVFSNSFDHAYEPEVTARMWWRALRSGGYLVLDFPQQQELTSVGIVAHVDLDDVRRIFPGEIAFFQYRGSASGYTTYIVRKCA